MAHGLTTAGGAVRIMGVTEYLAGIRGSLRLDARRLDHLGPLLGLIDDELAERAGTHRHRLAAEVSETGLYLRVAAERGPKGDPGLSGVTIRDWKIDRARYVATPLMSDGREGPPLELRELFQQFLTEAG